MGERQRADHDSPAFHRKDALYPLPMKTGIWVKDQIGQFASGVVHAPRRPNRQEGRCNRLTW